MTSIDLLAPSQACAGVPSHLAYNALGPEAADEARAAADRIRKLGCQQNEAIFAIGRKLITIRAKLSHGQWVSWLHAEFDMSVSTAERYISVAEKRPEKIVPVTNLRPTRPEAGGLPGALAARPLPAVAGRGQDHRSGTWVLGGSLMDLKQEAYPVRWLRGHYALSPAVAKIVAAEFGWLEAA